MLFSSGPSADPWYVRADRVQKRRRQSPGTALVPSYNLLVVAGQVVHKPARSQIVNLPI